MKRKDLKTRRMGVRVSPADYADLQEKFRTTIHRTFSDYIRDRILQKPLTVKYRNQSLDEFLPVALELKNELQSIGKSFSDAVKNTQGLPQQEELKEYLEFLAGEEFALRQTIREIKESLVKIYELWSQ